MANRSRSRIRPGNHGTVSGIRSQTISFSLQTRLVSGTFLLTFIVAIVSGNDVEVLAVFFDLLDGRSQVHSGGTLHHELVLAGHSRRGPGLDVNEVDAMLFENFQITRQYSDFFRLRGEDQAGALRRVSPRHYVVSPWHMLRLQDI